MPDTTTIPMTIFLDTVIAEIHKPEAGKNISKSIAMIALTNLITLPFGRISWSISRSKTRAEIKVDMESKLYSAFKTKFLEDSHSRQLKELHKSEYMPPRGFASVKSQSLIAKGPSPPLDNNRGLRFPLLKAQSSSRDPC